MKARVLYADEIDAIVEIGTDEGDQLAIFKKRGSQHHVTGCKTWRSRLHC